MNDSSTTTRAAWPTPGSFPINWSDEMRRAAATLRSLGLWKEAEGNESLADHIEALEKRVEQLEERDKAAAAEIGMLIGEAEGLGDAGDDVGAEVITEEVRRRRELTELENERDMLRAEVERLRLSGIQ